MNNEENFFYLFHIKDIKCKKKIFETDNREFIEYIS